MSLSLLQAELRESQPPKQALDYILQGTRKDIQRIIGKLQTKFGCRLAKVRSRILLRSTAGTSIRPWLVR